MAIAHYIYAMKGMDSSANKIFLPKEYASFAVNMSFRGNEASSRPPFINMVNEFPYAEGDEEEVFNNGNVSGVFGYTATIPLTQSYIIAAIGDSIFAGLVSGAVIQWRRIYKGIDPKWQMSFFCQANQYLVWQNGKDLPLYWDGISRQMLYCKDAPKVESPMPIGNIMVFAHGRIFVATEENLVYASNFAYSTGLEGYGVFNFTESQYFSGGDGFGAPASLGKITGAGVIQRIPDSNGHGPVVFFQERGAFAIDAAKPRDNWTNDPNIQQIVLTGRGCSSPFSVTAANGDLWYRCHDRTISSFKREVSQQEQWSNKALSKEVGIFTDYDSETTLLFSFSLFIDNRLLVAVGSRNEEPSDSRYGYHRYCLGMVSLDLDNGSTVLQDEPFTWDGLWTGPRVTGTAEVIVSSEKQGFVFSFDSDRKNRVYRVGSGVKNDATINGEKEIVSAFKSEGVFFDPSKMHTLSSTKVKFANAIGNVKIRQLFAPEDYQFFEELPYKEREGRFCSFSSTEGDCYSGGVSAPLSGSVTFKVGCSRPRIGTTTSTMKGEWFSLVTEFEGAMTIRYIHAYADESMVDKMDIEPKKITEPIDYCGYGQAALTYSFP
jgi:hypothetical protein